MTLLSAAERKELEIRIGPAFPFVTKNYLNRSYARLSQQRFRAESQDIRLQMDINILMNEVSN